MWRLSSFVFAALAFVVGTVAPVRAATGDGVSPAEDRRKRLGGKLGITKEKKEDPEPKDPEPDDPEPDDGDEDPPDDDDGDDAPSPTAPADPSKPAPAAKSSVVFNGKVHRRLVAKCKSCHSAGGSAGGTKYVLSGSTGADYKASRRFVKSGNASSSSLLSKAAGKGHAGGAPFATGSADYRLLRDWIDDGAKRGGGSSGAPAPVPTPVAPVVTPPSSSPSSPKAPAKPRRKPRSDPSPTGPPSEPTTPDPAAPTVAPSEPSPAEPAPAAPVNAYAPDVHELLVAKCKSCHQDGAIAGGGRLALTGDVDADFATATALVEPSEPDASVLLTKASGTAHGGGPTLPPGSPGNTLLREWIADGAVGPWPPRPEPAPTTDGSEPVQVDATTKASPPREPGSRLGDGTPLGPAASSSSGPPLHLPLSLRLHGKFDFSYERRDYRDHPFQDQGRNAFQTYHHFLFLSRAADDPFGINVELITQAFYEFSFRIAPKNRNFDALFKAGKILVPFGNEPLFHRSYGGRSGFDQEIFPIIWAQPGISGSMRAQAGPITISNDLYAVQGHALRDPEGILNLQSDISSVDEFKAAFGDRIGVSWRPLTGWYSFHFNRLGHDRFLFMQAVDLEFWRLADVPVLEDTVLGIGGMRADVSGSGPGDDYYHFGSYATVGYYPIDMLYLQYRGGLRTTDNRRGLYYDDRRADERDRSSHNLTVMARWRGLYGGLQFFWNLEKANELDDDFMRVTVGYEF